MQDLNPSSRSLWHRCLLLVAGWLLLAAGIVSVLHANLGAGPFDVLNTALADRLGIQVGTASWISTMVLVTLAALLGARPGPATFASAFAVGSLINVLLTVMPSPDSLTARATQLVAGTGMLYVGVCLIVIAGLGSGVVDLLMFAIHRKLHTRGVSLKAARWTIEITAALVGVLLGGSAGIATVLIALTAGPVLVRLLPRVNTLPLVAA